MLCPVEKTGRRGCGTNGTSIQARCGSHNEAMSLERSSDSWHRHTMVSACVEHPAAGTDGHNAALAQEEEEEEEQAEVQGGETLRNRAKCGLT